MKPKDSKSDTPHTPKLTGDISKENISKTPKAELAKDVKAEIAVTESHKEESKPHIPTRPKPKTEAETPETPEVLKEASKDKDFKPEVPSAPKPERPKVDKPYRIADTPKPAEVEETPIIEPSNEEVKPNIPPRPRAITETKRKEVKLPLHFGKDSDLEKILKTSMGPMASGIEVAKNRVKGPRKTVAPSGFLAQTKIVSVEAIAGPKSPSSRTQELQKAMASQPVSGALPASVLPARLSIEKTEEEIKSMKPEDKKKQKELEKKQKEEEDRRKKEEEKHQKELEKKQKEDDKRRKKEEEEEEKRRKKDEKSKKTAEKKSDDK